MPSPADGEWWRWYSKRSYNKRLTSLPKMSHTFNNVVLPLKNPSELQSLLGVGIVEKGLKTSSPSLLSCYTPSNERPSLATSSRLPRNSLHICISVTVSHRVSSLKEGQLSPFVSCCVPNTQLDAGKYRHCPCLVSR